MFKYSSFKIHHTISKKFVSAEGSLQCFEVQENPAPLRAEKKNDQGEDFRLKYPARDSAKAIRPVVLSDLTLSVRIRAVGPWNWIESKETGRIACPTNPPTPLFPLPQEEKSGVKREEKRIGMEDVEPIFIS